MSFFSMGDGTHRIPKELYAINRKKLVDNLNKEKKFENYAVFLEGGKSTTRYDSDHEPIFRQESYFHYLFGVREPDFSGLIIKNGSTVCTCLFMPKLPDSYGTCPTYVFLIIWYLYLAMIILYILYQPPSWVK